MTHLYAYLQWAGWGLLYGFMALMIASRHVFVETELLYGAVLLAATGTGSHLLRNVYRHVVASSAIPKQVCVLIGGSILVAASATLLLLICFFLLTLTDYSFPVPPAQRWFVIKTIFTGNFFNMLLAMLLWSAVYFAVTKVRLLRQTTALLQATQLDALVSQLNPHFLFNAINNIRALILEDPERARHMLALMSDMLRYNLTPTAGTKERIKVPLKQELEIVHSYLALCSIQFEQRLHYQQQIDSNCTELAVPKLLLQLCVENAVKHGISRLPEGGTISISANTHDHNLQLRVTNHGTLHPDDDKSSGVGLRNIRQRLQLLYQGRASLRLYQHADQVITEILIPMESYESSTY